MEKSQNPSVLKPALLGFLGLVALSVTGQAFAAQEQARVISSTPVIEQIAVPQEVCRNETVTVPARKSGAGALIGGIAGGAMGNAVGNGSGRAAATVIGVIGGAVLGDRIEGRGQPDTQTMRQCQTRTVYENETVAYDVVYEYAGRRYTTQMEQDPGRYVLLNISPADLEIEEPMPPVRYRSEAPYPQERGVTRIEVGTTYIPTYTLPPRVVYIGGQREFRDRRGHGRHPLHRNEWRDERSSHFPGTRREHWERID